VNEEQLEGSMERWEKEWEAIRKGGKNNANESKEWSEKERDMIAKGYRADGKGVWQDRKKKEEC
jgi:hypothetical protein